MSFSGGHEWYNGGMKLTADGQITIPEAVRRALGWQPGTEVALEVEGNALRVVEAGEARAARMREAIGSVAGIAKGERTTDDVMRLTRGED